MSNISSLNFLKFGFCTIVKMNVSAFVIFIVASLQVHQALSIYHVQAPVAPTPPQPNVAIYPAPKTHNVRHSHAASTSFVNAHATLDISSNPHSHFIHPHLPGGGLHNIFNPYASPYYYHAFGQDFYKECGTTIRRCDWVKKMTAGHKFPHVHNQVHHQMHVQAPEADSTSTPEMDLVCYSKKHICVGNTENCVSNKDCDVAMKIMEGEIETNGKTQITSVFAVSHLNNCSIDGQSVADDLTMPQMMFGIGFAPYDATGQTLECRPVKASDFKLVFLWKNSTVAYDSDKGRCKPKMENHLVVQQSDTELLNAVHKWPQACKGMANKQETFSLKSFLSVHLPTSEYTSFFSPPFNFADGYEPQYSSNNMVISGVVN